MGDSSNFIILLLCVLGSSSDGHYTVTTKLAHQYLSVEQKADQAFTQLLHNSAGHPLPDCCSPC